MINKCWGAKSRQLENSSRCDSLVNLSHSVQMRDMYYAPFHKLYFWNFKMYEYIALYLIKKRLHRPLLKLYSCYWSPFSCNPFVSQLLHILQFYILTPHPLNPALFPIHSISWFIPSFPLCVLLCFYICSPFWLWTFSPSVSARCLIFNLWSSLQQTLQQGSFSTQCPLTTKQIQLTQCW